MQSLTYVCSLYGQLEQLLNFKARMRAWCSLHLCREYSACKGQYAACVRCALMPPAVPNLIPRSQCSSWRLPVSECLHPRYLNGILQLSPSAESRMSHHHGQRSEGTSKRTHWLWRALNSDVFLKAHPWYVLVSAVHFKMCTEELFPPKTDEIRNTTECKTP